MRAILVSLKAAGLVGKKRRPIAEIEADIAATTDRLRTLKRERKSLICSEKAKRQHQDPEYVAKFHGGRAAMYRDPVKRAAWLAKIRDSSYAHNWRLPAMTREQKLAYYRLLRKGVPRHEALPVALR